MTAEELKTLQAPLKARYKEVPAAAAHTLAARGTLDVAALTCSVRTWSGEARGGLHPAAGGDEAQPPMCTVVARDRAPD